jgi:hypothetical protein
MLIWGFVGRLALSVVGKVGDRPSSDDRVVGALPDRG